MIVLLMTLFTLYVAAMLSLYWGIIGIIAAIVMFSALVSILVDIYGHVKLENKRAEVSFQEAKDRHIEALKNPANFEDKALLHLQWYDKHVAPTRR